MIYFIHYKLPTDIISLKIYKKIKKYKILNCCSIIYTIYSLKTFIKFPVEQIY